MMGAVSVCSSCWGFFVPYCLPPDTVAVFLFSNGDGCKWSNPRARFKGEPQKVFEVPDLFPKHKGSALTDPSPATASSPAHSPAGSGPPGQSIIGRQSSHGFSVKPQNSLELGYINPV